MTAHVRKTLGVQEIVDRFARKEFDLKKLGMYAQAVNTRECIVLVLRMADEAEPQEPPMESSGDTT